MVSGGNHWGGACYDDLMAITDTMCCFDSVDPNRIGAMGGSFGGYMTNWIGVNSERFQALVTHASLFALSQFSCTTDFPAWFQMAVGEKVSPFTASEAFDRYSPHRLIERWKTPTLILHGEKDYRVPIGEALALFEALQLHGVQSELLVFPDENHWILKPQNIIAWHREILRFLKTQLHIEDLNIQN